MTLVFFLFVDGDAVLTDLAGSEFVSVEFLRLGLSVKTLKTPIDTTRLLATIKCLVMRILG